MKNKTDIELYKLTKTGDNAAFEELFRRYHQKGFNIAFRLLASPEAAEDAVMETFVRLYKADYNITVDFPAYFYRAVINQSYNHIRSKNKENRLFGEAAFSQKDDPMNVTLEKLKEQQAEKALLSLPERQRAAFVLIAYEGLSYKDAANVMKISVKAIEALISRARENLKKVFKDMDVVK
jgi:RNA polymerase sigma-70 factor (ECF subfamily)